MESTLLLWTKRKKVKAGVNYSDIGGGGGSSPSSVLHLSLGCTSAARFRQVGFFKVL